MPLVRPSSGAPCQSLSRTAELRGAKNGVDLGQGFMELTGPQGNAFIGVLQYLLEQ